MDSISVSKFQIFNRLLLIDQVVIKVRGAAKISEILVIDPRGEHVAILSHLLDRWST